MSQQPTRPPVDPATVDESDQSEIVIYPDGRVYAFGITHGVIAVLASLPSTRGPGRRIVDRISTDHPGPSHD